MDDPAELPIEIVEIASLRPHPRNYQKHPDDELEHIAESIRSNGYYRNIVIAQDSTILAGHGVVESASKKLGLTRVPVRRLPVDPDSPRALKVLAGDNELGHLSERDDRLLSEILREVRENDVAGLVGTGYDELMLANLVFVSRSQDEIRDIIQAGHWVGMPEYHEEGGVPTLAFTIHVANETDLARVAELLGIRVTPGRRSAWWPPRQDDDTSAIRWQAAAADG